MASTGYDISGSSSNASGATGGATGPINISSGGNKPNWTAISIVGALILAAGLFVLWKTRK